jgi:hypothetical protein
VIIQPRGFKRRTTSAGLIDVIRKRVEQAAAMYNCSKSFVIATLLADAFGISNEEQAKYYELERTSKRINKARRGSKVVRFRQRA